ncbi:MAG: hypothetical protein WCX90_07730 [Thiohalomonadaceae bacterium]
MMVKKFINKALRQLGRGVGAMMVLTFGALLTVMLVSSPSEEMTEVSATEGWGSESLLDAHHASSRISPISLANACGMGASSCFKCHNGKRAGAPDMDSATAPWHTQHKTVNGSCVGCHKGNPRVMKEEVAHKNLLADPRTDLTNGCVSCHRGDDLEELSKVYMSLNGGGN